MRASWVRSFSGGSMVKNPPANAGDLGSIPGLGRSPGGGYSNSLQNSCLENPMDRGVWRATVHRASKTQIQLKLLSIHCRANKGKDGLFLEEYNIIRTLEESFLH